MKNKLRLRTKNELEDRKKGFFEIINILKSKNIFFFLQGGVLLGAVRNNDFIQWDWDVEISLFSDEFFEKRELIKNALLENGFKIFKENYERERIKIDVYKYQDYATTGYTLFGWTFNKEKNKILRGEINIPSKFMDNMEKITFLDEEFYCPGPVNDYLTYQYGNWRKEIRSDIKNEYLSNKFYKKKSFMGKVLNKIKKIFK
jgi:phosphorylcholine metabolism protein LicD